MKKRSRLIRIFRFGFPAILLISSLLCGYNAVYFAWAHTAPPDTHNDYYEKWYYIYGILFVIQPLVAAAIIYFLRPKTKVEPAGSGQPM